MTPERFAALAEAYGGDIHRWPEQTRAAAQLRLAADPEARRTLEPAAGLDALLGAYAVAPPSPELQRRILTAGAARGRLFGPRRWLSLLGAAGTLGAGAALGAALVLVLAPVRHTPDAAAGFYEQSSFGDLAQADDPPLVSPRT